MNMFYSMGETKRGNHIAKNDSLLRVGISGRQQRGDGRYANQQNNRKQTLVFECVQPNRVIRRVAIDHNVVVVRVNLHFLAVHLCITPIRRFYDQLR